MTPIIHILVKLIVGAPVLWLALLMMRHYDLFDFTRMP